jgi:quercetin dioxygenase-like cupin family protein
MKIIKLNKMKRGWMIGDFEPSILKTDLFEIAYLTHKKDEIWPNHYHAIATEYNLLVRGSMTVCYKKINPGEIFIIEPNEEAAPIFHEDCEIVCIKVPSLPKDKHEVF